MKTKKGLWGILAVLVVLCVIFGIMHLRGKEATAPGTIRIEEGGATRELDLTKEERILVSGTVVNGKGEEREIEAEGLSLSSIPQGPCEKLQIIAKDEYKAEVMQEEFENAFLILTEEESVRLIVFGDENSKRDVKDVEKIVVE